MNGIPFLYQARSLDTKLLWVKELREVIQQFQFGTLQERSKCIVTIDFLYTKQPRNTYLWVSTNTAENITDRCLIKCIALANTRLLCLRLASYRIYSINRPGAH